MRFLFDVCFPDLLADALRADGHDCLFMRRIDARASDADILASALADRRIILTRDWDYGELVVRHGLPTAGVMILVTESEAAESEAARAWEVVRTYGEALLRHLTIVEPHKIRRRLAPAETRPTA